MRPGTVIADRYTILRLAGSGGMGSVFQARDGQTGAMVALKVIRSDDPELTRRLLREARLLSELNHPNIVRYLGHGLTAAGEPYLTMEWLVGEDLAQRLKRGTLTVPETMAVARHLCTALAVAHRRGIVHRDVKPHNVVLLAADVDGETNPSGLTPDAVAPMTLKLVDFGVAHLGTGGFTGTGQALGTPGYMAPEQARGSAAIDARADLFAVGCVIFACLLQRAPFVGEHAQAILAKILFEEAPRLRDLRPDAPLDLDALVARLLAKDPAARPADADAVLALLGDEHLTLPGRPLAPLPAVGAREQQYVCVLMTRPPSVEASRALGERLDALAGSHGARLEHLAGGGLVAVFPPSSISTDVAARAALLALALRPLLGGVPMVLATGRGELAEGTLPMGEVIDRATHLVETVLPDPGEEIILDDVTAGLLEMRFEVYRDSEGASLLRERDPSSGARRLLGKTTPCVGRDRELATLSALFTECIEEPRARAVLVTGVAGSGKSRLRQEALARIAASEAEPEVWIGRGDAMRGGAPLALLADALRAPMDLRGGEEPLVRRAKIRERAARHTNGADLTRVSEFLGELCGTPFPSEESVQLAAARQDPLLMADQVRRAFEDFIAAEVALRPIVLVLEDLHWGDWPSIKLVDAALRHVANAPFFVLALGRPEVHDIFTGLWAERPFEEVRLRELGKMSCERLIKQVLGPLATVETVALLTQRSQGNPFYLEELIRAVADGGGELPETVLAMVQARLGRLPPQGRQVLRAASPFGEVFWDGGVAKLLGERAGSETRQLLAELGEREWVAPRRESRFRGNRELAFGHALLREAAYATLTNDDRVLAHQLAAAWLEQAGEGDPTTLAEHHQRGGDSARAITWWTRAAQRALDGSDFVTALAHVTRAVALGAAGEELGALRLIEAEARSWRAEHAEAYPPAAAALALLPRGSDHWANAVHHAAWALRVMGKNDELAALAAELDAVCAERASGPLVISLAAVSVKLTEAGLYAQAARLLERIEAHAAGVGQGQPLVQAWIATAKVWRAAVAGNPDETRRYLLESIVHWDEAGDQRNACNMRANVGITSIELGDFEGAERELRSAVVTARRLAIEPTVAGILQNLGWLLGQRGQAAEAVKLLDESIASFHARGDGRNEGISRLYLARAHLLAGAHDAARAACSAAQPLLAGLASWRAYALAVQAELALVAGDVAGARAAADEALALARALEALEEGDAYVRCVAAESAERSGEHEVAAALAREATQRLEARAAKVLDAGLRASFLERVPDHARTTRMTTAVLRAT
jgi:tetratricopeptide (TPR) repeat protein